ncbi:Tim44/TimA family putative adaptor protein [Nitratireductor sp. StC3]|uniref:Tim44/TimA family putative adaptor protein n=1 Tax=Nitratireductor sp. StC3 TaxID=2126741 RepID=UPI000D0E1933|nr:Tim44/TimA family putative adaptor protein [Nitratireductor sp. StC3]PSM15818.1 hypothetical protein C7T96_23380 [Nitratireductor sp. StC3]
MTATLIEDGAAQKGVAKILRFDPAFDLNMFLNGVRHAYEIIVEAFAAGDMEKLAPLVSKEVLAVFAESCAARASREEIVDLTLIGIEDIDIVHVDVDAVSMEVTLCFHAQMIWVERTAEGTITGGDPQKIIDVAEAWTFARSNPAAGNAWILLATSG